MERTYTELKVSNQGNYFKVDNSDLWKVAGFSWRASKTGYLRAKINNKTIMLHRWVMNATEGEVIDHINGDLLDCRKTNLRSCSIMENSRNRKISKNSSTGYKGVHTVYKDRFRAVIRVNRKLHYLGYFKSALEAASAYDTAALKHFGEFAKLNFPPHNMAICKNPWCLQCNGD